jgi:hypothetical protein
MVSKLLIFAAIGKELLKTNNRYKYINSVKGSGKDADFSSSPKTKVAVSTI